MFTRRAHGPLLITLLAAGLATAGCKSQKPELSYLQAYDQKLYAEALAKAAPVAETPEAPDRERAALVAGMSAHALGQPQDAKRFLTPLKNSANNEVAGKARTTLGLAAESRGDSKQASLLLATGSEKLAGDDAARAKLHAGSNLEKLGMTDLARKQYQAGVTEADDPKLKSLLTDRSVPTVVYLQTGAYLNRVSADAQARLIARSVIRAGQPTPKVVPTKSTSGRTLYGVQIGPYGDTEAATRGLLAIQKQGVKTATMTRRREG